MKRIFGRGRYANVTSTMALIVALGGTAYAANTVRSSDIVNGQVKRADIANNAVNSAKVANGALRVGDFRAADRALLRGPAGPAGAAGAAGATGATGATGAVGPRGPSDGFSVQSGTNVLTFPAANTDLTVATLNLPAGKFVLNAKVIMNNNDASVRQYGCSLRLGATTVDSLFDNTDLDVGPSGPEDDRSIAALTGAGTLAAAGTATVVCRTNAVAGNYLARSITAVQVATLNGT